MNVRERQVALYRLGYDCKGIDSIEGPNTLAAYEAFKDVWGSDLDSALQTALRSVPPFIEARNLTRANRPTSSPIDLIVIHTMEAPEKPGTARAVAEWFAGSAAPQASAHYCIDADEVLQSVLECDIAWAAPGANSNGVHLEHAGYASQTPADWNDNYSKRLLDNSAALAARLARRFSIPIRKVTAEELAQGATGFIGHVDATNAFNNGRGHTDPGSNFPWDAYIALVKTKAGGVYVSSGS